MKLVTVKTFSDSFEANICKGRLEAEGIDCFLMNETVIAANPLLTNAFGGYQLQCSEEDSEKAIKLITEKTNPS